MDDIQYFFLKEELSSLEEVSAWGGEPETDSEDDFTLYCKVVMQNLKLDSDPNKEVTFCSNKDEEFNVSWQLTLKKSNNNRNNVDLKLSTVLVDIGQTYFLYRWEIYIMDRYLDLSKLKGTFKGNHFTKQNFPIQDYLWKNDTLVIVCKFLAAFKRNEYDSTYVIDNTQNDALKDFEKLFNEEDNTFSDITFVIKGQKIKAHKNVLALRSPVFHEIFSKNKKTNEIEIKDIDYDTMKKLLQFIYTGKIKNFNSEIAKSLIDSADKYSIASLKKKCEAILKKKDNVL